ncbi:MAG: pyridoxamine 5'-phosphate oxidase family protein [Candidatus Limnocylindrales bacterium]
MRRNLPPEALGDLLTRPQHAILALYRADGTVLQTPVWQEWREGSFWFYIPGGDRKITMLRHDPRVSIVVAAVLWPYPAIQVDGHVEMSTAGARDVARRIAARFDPTRPPDAYIGDEDPVLCRVVAKRTRAWDYSDEKYT